MNILTHILQKKRAMGGGVKNLTSDISSK